MSAMTKLPTHNVLIKAQPGLRDRARYFPTAHVANLIAARHNPQFRALDSGLLMQFVLQDEGVLQQDRRRWTGLQLAQQFPDLVTKDQIPKPKAIGTWHESLLEQHGDTLLVVPLLITPDIFAAGLSAGLARPSRFRLEVRGDDISILDHKASTQTDLGLFIRLARPRLREWTPKELFKAHGRKLSHTCREVIQLHFRDQIVQLPAGTILKFTRKTHRINEITPSEDFTLKLGWQEVTFQASNTIQFLSDKRVRGHIRPLEQHGIHYDGSYAILHSDGFVTMGRLQTDYIVDEKVFGAGTGFGRYRNGVIQCGTLASPFETKEGYTLIGETAWRSNGQLHRGTLARPFESAEGYTITGETMWHDNGNLMFASDIGHPIETEAGYTFIGQIRWRNNGALCGGMTASGKRIWLKTDVTPVR